MTAETWLALLAIGISLFSILLQYTIEGPKIDILNSKDVQQTVVRLYSGLPKSVRVNFAHLSDESPGHALVKLVFGNAGDRAGYINIVNMEIKNAHGLIKISNSR